VNAGCGADSSSMLSVTLAPTPQQLHEDDAFALRFTIQEREFQIR